MNDAFDLDCFNATDNREASSVSNCLDGADNDGDGWIDTLDNDCESGDESGGYSGSICNDEIDNDGDGLIDAEDSRLFTNAADADEFIEQCEDGLDNDSDGWVDLADPDCTDGNYYETGFGNMSVMMASITMEISIMMFRMKAALVHLTRLKTTMRQLVKMVLMMTMMAG